MSGSQTPALSLLLLDALGPATTPPGQYDNLLISQAGVARRISYAALQATLFSGSGSYLGLSGAPSNPANFAGQMQANNFEISSTPVSDSLAEGGFLVSLVSNKGAPSGNGPTSAYKIGGAIQVTGNPGSGNVYGLNLVTTLNAGFGNFTGAGMEINTNNFNHDYPFDGSGGGVSYPFQILANSTFPVTAAIAIGTIDPSHYAYNAGIYFSTLFGAKFASIYDICNSQYSYHDTGTHSSASHAVTGVSPIGYFSAGTYTTSAFQDTGNAPYGMVLNGVYSTAALDIMPSNTGPIGIIISGAEAASIKDVGSAVYSYRDVGTHSAASIAIQATTPIGLFSSGTYTTAAIQEDGTAPYGAAFVGTYSSAAITINPIGGSGIALSVLQGEKICFSGLDVSMAFTGTKLIAVKGGVSIFSVDMTTGNAIFKGSVTQNGTP